MKLVRKSIKYTLMSVGLLALLGAAFVIVVVIQFPDSRTAQWVERIAQKQTTPPQELSDNIYTVFRVTLQNEVKDTIGTPIEGYEPSMFLSVFPGLTETDFEGVEASIGSYTVENGRLVHKLDNTKLIHSAAKAITDRGMNILLQNVSARLKVDLANDGTLTKIMDALIYEGMETIVPPSKDIIACTLDAKMCPDGSYVGRVGPSCEFAPCP